VGNNEQRAMAEEGSVSTLGADEEVGAEVVEFTEQYARGNDEDELEFEEGGEKKDALAPSTIKGKEGEDGDHHEEGEEEGDRGQAQGMVVDGFRCPEEFELKLSPMEFEEMVSLFQTYDANGSGTIDKHEARKILQGLGMEASLEKAEELLAMVDGDGSGEIDFDEFCTFIVLIKEGDEKLAAFNDLLENIHETPLGTLEKAAKQQGYKLAFFTVEQREATATNPAIYVVELHMTGMFYEMVVGKGAVGTFTTVKFQGLGVTNREAKYAAAKQGNMRLAKMMPGVRFKEGEFPDEWITWVDENLLRGVDPNTIVGILASKGFHPHRSTSLMQRLIVWQDFDIFSYENQDFEMMDAISIDFRFQLFVERIVAKGIEGAVLLRVAEERGVPLTIEFPHFAQKLKNNEFGPLLGKDGSNTKMLDFLVACECGYVNDVQLYCSCTQPVDEEHISRTTGQLERPLFLAAMNGHTEVVKVLLKYNVDTKAFDRRGRTALHRAAMNGHTETCICLIEQGKAPMFEADFLGNTALHLAAFYNRHEVVSYLAFKGQDYTRTVTSDKVRCKAGVTFNELSEKVRFSIHKHTHTHTHSSQFTLHTTHYTQYIYIYIYTHTFNNKVSKSALHRETGEKIIK